MSIRPTLIISVAVASIVIGSAGATKPASAADYWTGSYGRYDECDTCERFVDRDVRWRHRWREGYGATVIERPAIVERRVVVERPIIERRVIVERPAIVERRSVFVETAPVLPRYGCCY
jgi:hypothetical protein